MYCIIFHTMLYIPVLLLLNKLSFIHSINRTLNMEVFPDKLRIVKTNKHIVLVLVFDILRLTLLLRLPHIHAKSICLTETIYSCKILPTQCIYFCNHMDLKLLLESHHISYRTRSRHINDRQHYPSEHRDILNNCLYKT